MRKCIFLFFNEKSAKLKRKFKKKTFFFNLRQQIALFFLFIMNDKSLTQLDYLKIQISVIFFDIFNIIIFNLRKKNHYFFSK